MKWLYFKLLEKKVRVTSIEELARLLPGVLAPQEGPAEWWLIDNGIQVQLFLGLVIL